jgi:hypothetical protein
MRLDLKQFTRVEWGVIIAGGLAFISLFLPWYGVSVAGFSASVSGWNTSYGWLGGLLMTASAVCLALMRSDVKLPELPVSSLFVVLGTSALGLLIVALRWLTLPRGGSGLSGVGSYSYGGRAGIWLALIVGIVQLVCAVLLFRESGEKLPWPAASSEDSAA